MSQPAISVIMGAYNAEKYLHKAIESILNQTYDDFEFIVIDDGSKDSTGNIIDEYAAKDPRIVAIHHANMGHANSLNKALGIAKAPLIARMDADDIALPQRFEKQVEFLNNHPQIAVLGTSIRLIDGEGQVIRDEIYPASTEAVDNKILQGSPLAHPTIIMRKSVVDEMGGYRTVFDPAEDYDLWLRISEKYKIANLPEVHLLYRQHNDKLSFKHSQYQTLCTFVLQLASKIRRKGLADPLENSGRITADTLKLFDLSKEQEIDLLFKTYGYTLYSLVENNDDNGISELFETMQKTYGEEYFQKMKYMACIAVFRNYYDRHEYLRSYRYLFKIFPYSPVRVFIELARSVAKQLMPASLKRFLKKILRRA